MAFVRGLTARRALPAAVLWSLSVHVFLFSWAVLQAPRARVAPDGARATRTVEFTAELGRPTVPTGKPAVGQPMTPVDPGEEAPTVPGPADAYHPEMASPWPNADVDTPDLRAAARGGGDTGGTPSWTGRNDVDEELRAQPLNDPDTYRLERHADSRQRRSPESIARETAPDIDNAHRERKRRARRGETAPAPQPDQGDPSARVERAPDAEGTDPRPGSPAPPADPEVARLAQDGAIVTHAGRPVHKEGAEATEATVHGPRSDDANAAQASNEPHPIPLELDRPSAGGTGGKGVAGPTPGAGNSARAPRQGTGQGGSPANLVQTPRGQASTAARAQEAYLRKLFKRVLDHLVYPPELAASLEQGEVVVSFNLRKDGTIADLRVSRPSGYKQFDDAAVGAVRRAAPFGPVPPLITGGRDVVRVQWPITFANPVIR